MGGSLERLDLRHLLKELALPNPYLAGPRGRDAQCEDR